jgi:RimJ/RimL family protein N-acetyltransferase
MNIHGEKVIIRSLELEDMDFLLETINDPVMESLVIGWSFPISKIQQKLWYEKVILDNTNHRFAITLNSIIIGIATITKIDWKNRSAYHGIKLGNNTPKGQGIGTDSVFAIMKYAFEELQLNRLGGSMLKHNTASIKLYEKCGWKQEGVARQSIFKNNQYHDEILVSILKEDYLEMKRQ